MELDSLHQNGDALLEQQANATAMMQKGLQTESQLRAAVQALTLERDELLEEV